MAISGKYGKIDIPKISTNEPVFILRAQDKLAGATIGMYRLLASTHDVKLADNLQREIDAFRDWGGKKKLPD